MFFKCIATKSESTLRFTKQIHSILREALFPGVLVAIVFFLSENNYSIWNQTFPLKLDAWISRAELHHEWIYLSQKAEQANDT